MREAIFLLSLATVNSGIALRVVEPMLPELATEFGTSASAAALIISAYGLSYACAQLCWGRIGDRYGKLRLSTITLFGAGAASIGCAFAEDIATLSALRFATGLFASTPFLLGMAYIGDRVEPATLQPVIARFSAGTITGQAIGPFVGGAVTDLVGWRGTFALIGLVFAAVAVLLLVRTRSEWAQDRGRPITGNPFATHVQLLRLPRVRRVMSVSFLETFFFFGAFSFLGVYLKLRFDLSLTLIGTLLAGFGVGGVMYTLMVRRLLMELGQRGLVLWGAVGTCGLFVLAALTPTWWMMAPAIIGMGYCLYMMHNVVQTKATEMAPQDRGTGLSMYSASWASGQAAGAAAIGVVVQFAGYAPAIIGCGIGFLALGLWLRARLERL